MPLLAVTYEGGNPAATRQADAIELTPETLARFGGGAPRIDDDVWTALREGTAKKPVLVHGVTLSIGSCPMWNDAYFTLLERCFEELPNILWHSEHLGFTRVDGAEICTMLPVPCTQEALDLVTARVETIRERFDRPFLLEPVVNLLPAPPGDYTEAAFLNALTSRTGCGILLDAYNLVCDARNHGRDVSAFLDELDLSRVRELHLAGGVEMDGVQLDVHTAGPEQDTLTLADDILQRASGIEVVTFELLREGFEMLGEDGVLAELRRLADWLAACR